MVGEGMQRAYSKVSAEMPNTKRVSVTPSTSSTLSSMFMPRGAYAVTNPFTGNITYNPDMMIGQSQDDMEQTIAHELVHVNQTNPWYGHISEIGGNLLNNVKSLWGGNEDRVPPGISPTSPMNDPYQWRSHELEAFQAERDRARRNQIPDYVDPVLGTRDIMLPAAKKPGIDTASETMRKKRGM